MTDVRRTLPAAAGRVALPLLLLAIVPLLLTCKRAPERPPIIVISIDTLRSDRLPMYGYRDVETPALDALRRDAVLFSNAWSHSPLTLPSHATMLTGLLPSAHGVRDNTGFRLGGDVAHAAAVLRANGYATGAAVSAFVLRASTGMSAGFDAYDDRFEKPRGEKSLGHIQRAGADTVAVAQEWIATHAGRPFFYFLHLYEPHSPYEPPEPFATKYASSPYDGEVAQTDAVVGRFLTFLREQGLYDRAMIVLVSDHGEGLGDHGEDEHGIFLYREALAVPMLVKLPGGALAGEATDIPAGLFDVTPTILAAAGIEVPKPMDGRALFDDHRLANGEPRALYAETWYPRFHFGWSELHSLVEGREHFIDAPKEELYDIGSDPKERVNLVRERRRRLLAMRDAIAPYQKEAAAPSAVTTEELEKLAALGYIGSGMQHREGPRADPKDKIATFRELQAAFRLSREGRNEEAVVAFDRLLEKEPEIVDLWDVRSKALLRLGRTKEGIASAKEALRRNPAATHIAADLANALLLDGQIDEARQHAELALKSDPAKAHAILARVRLAQNDLAGAESEARTAVEAGGDVDAALYTLAVIQQKRGDFAGVLETTARLPAASPARGVSSLRGDALARLGRDREAEAEFRKELAAFPDNSEAARRLVLLLVAQGRNDEATNVIRALAAASPTTHTYAAISETLRVVGDADGARYWNARARGAHE